LENAFGQGSNPVILDVGGSINGGIPKWMVDKGKAHLKWMILDGVPLFQETSM